MKALKLAVQPVDLNVAGFDCTSDISSKQFRVKFGDQDGNVKEDILACSLLNVNAVNRTYNLEIEGRMSSPVSFERLAKQLERCQH